MEYEGAIENMKTADGAAKTREEAIQEALRELALELSDIEKIEILDEGSRGLLGFGARDVRVRLHADDLPEEQPRRGGRPNRGPRRESRGHDEKGSRDEDDPKSGEKSERPARRERQANRKDGRGPRKDRQARGGGRGNRSEQREGKRPRKARAPYKVDVAKEAKGKGSESSGRGSSPRRGRNEKRDRGPHSERAPRPKRQPRRDRPERKQERPPMDPEAAAAMGNAAAALLQEVIAKMGMESTVTSELRTEGDILLNVASEDSAILIGRKGRNLSAMQLLLNRMIGNTEEGENFDRIVVDVEGYLARHRTSLEEMAIGLAQKAKDTGRSMRVKPLNPQERRIIHLTLEKDDDIQTFSLGSSLHRRVIIVPNNAEDDGESNNWEDAEEVEFDVEETESLSSEQDDSR